LYIKFIKFVLQLLVIGLQAYAIILPVNLYNLVMGLCLCFACYNYFSFWCVQWVLMPSEKWRDGCVCLWPPIHHIRDVSGLPSKDIPYYSLPVPW